ncbi:hypothetical protein ACJX0J_038288, partial [Zea mays]
MGITISCCFGYLNAYLHYAEENVELGLAVCFLLLNKDNKREVKTSSIENLFLYEDNGASVVMVTNKQVTYPSIALGHEYLHDKRKDIRKLCLVAQGALLEVMQELRCPRVISKATKIWTRDNL